MRRKYALLITVCVTVLTILVLVIGLAVRMSLETLLAVFVPLLPTIVWGIREIRKQRDTSEDLDQFIQDAERIWIRARANELSIDGFQQESRALQDQIYDHRRKNSPVPEWIYKHFRDSQEEQMNKGAESFVSEALESLKGKL